MTYTVTSGAIPPGLNFALSGKTLTIGGTPTATGNINFTVTATDSSTGDMQTRNYTLTVNPAFQLPPPPPSPTSPLLPTPPTLNVPPLLAFLDHFLGGVEMVNAGGTETIRDSVFGIPLLVSTFGASGNLESVTLFGFNITFLFL